MGQTGAIPSYQLRIFAILCALLPTLLCACIDTSSDGLTQSQSSGSSDSDSDPPGGPGILSGIEANFVQEPPLGMQTITFSYPSGFTPAETLFHFKSGDQAASCTIPSDCLEEFDVQYSLPDPYSFAYEVTESFSLKPLSFFVLSFGTSGAGDIAYSNVYTIQFGDYTPPPPPGPPVFVEEDGIVVMEIESMDPTGDWVEETSLTGFKGDSYYRWNGPDYFNIPGHGVIKYRVQISTPGNYEFRLHNRHDHTDSSLENDCWVRLNGGEWIKAYSNDGSYGFWMFKMYFEFVMSSHKHKPPIWYGLEEGIHEIEISGRSKNFMIDRIHFFKVGTPGALDLSLPESPTL